MTDEEGGCVELLETSCPLSKVSLSSRFSPLRLPRANLRFLHPGLSANAFKTVMEIDTMGTYNTYKATIEEICRAKGTC